MPGDIVERKAPPAHYLVEIDSFSLFDELGIEKYETRAFEVGGYKWKIKVYPDGVGEASGRFASIFLQHVASDNPCERVKASCTISLKSQVSDELHVTKARCGRWFSASPMNKWGWTSFIDLDSLKDPNKGYIVNGCVHLEIELSVHAVEEENAVPSSISFSA
ncbi:ubiquitin carboxyl-terminal hydrolase 13 [Phtheirospermum japonicum]|uniref:Ubiquitin carboxyl-terminal hydrolase 13 n=1 Tax=Phtheirospermum japonicum TaxID=374723 RepID=A0A830D7B2_9LAMI|nr:ubiquitin carboxyl-terminal hydrolase 13 [Phtheirospermum japonicum]